MAHTLFTCRDRRGFEDSRWLIAEGKHPYPSRTRKLSPPAPMVLASRGAGRVGRRLDFHFGRGHERSSRTSRERFRGAGDPPRNPGERHPSCRKAPWRNSHRIDRTDRRWNALRLRSRHRPRRARRDPTGKAQTGFISSLRAWALRDDRGWGRRRGPDHRWSIPRREGGSSPVLTSHFLSWIRGHHHRCRIDTGQGMDRSSHPPGRCPFQQYGAPCQRLAPPLRRPLFGGGPPWRDRGNGRVPGTPIRSPG